MTNRRQLARLGLVLTVALAVSGCQGESADLVPPTAPPSGSPTPAPATTTAATEGAGELANATIAMPFPDWGSDEACPRTPLTYTNGLHRGTYSMVGGGISEWLAGIAAVARTDVDRDGTDEIIAKAQCIISDGDRYQVFALRPDGTGGYTTMGVVIEPSVGSGVHDPATTIHAIGYVAVTSTGEVIVNVSSGESGAAPWQPPPVWQPRTFAWSGNAFTQTGGPTTFAADPAVASFTVTPQIVTQGGPSGGDRTGTLSVGIKAHGPQAVPIALLVFEHDLTAREGGDWGGCQHGQNDDWTLCDLGVLKAGDERTITLPVLVHDNDSIDVGYVQLRTDLFEYERVRIPRP